MAHTHLTGVTTPPSLQRNTHTHIYIDTRTHWRPGCAYGSQDGEDLQRWHFDDYLLLRNAAAGASGAAQWEWAGGGQEAVVAMSESGLGLGRGVSFVAIVSVNMGMGVATLDSNLRKKSLISWLRQNEEKFWFGYYLWIFKLGLSMSISAVTITVIFKTDILILC